MPKVGVEAMRREQVIEATKRSIAKKGVSKLSIKDIASEGGISTGIIYHYFDNKEDLLLQVIRKAFAQSHEKVMETVEPLDSPRDKLFKHIENINSVPVDNPDFYTVFLNYLGHAQTDSDVNKIITKFFDNIKSYIRNYLEEGIKKGEFSEEKVKNIPEIILALGMGFGIMWTLDRNSFAITDMGECYKAVIRKYIE